MTLEFDGHVTAVAASWSVFFALWLLGEILLPLEKIYEIYPYCEEFYCCKTYSWATQSLSVTWILAEAMLFPTFYLIFFGIFPVILIIFLTKAMNDDVEAVFFLDLNEGNDLNTEEVFLWLAVYCLCGCSFSIMLNCCQMIPTRWKNDELFQKFPLQYHEKLFKQFALLGSFFLLGSTSSAVYKLKSDVFEDSNLDSLMKACICVPFALLIKFGYKGYMKMFSFFFIGITTGVQSSFFIGHVIGSCLTLYFIGQSNDLAAYVLICSLVGFVFLPNLIWMLNFSRAKIHSTYTDKDKHYELFATELIRFQISGRSSAIGLKHWVWAPTKPYKLPISAFIVRAPTETDNSQDLEALRCYFEVDVSDNPYWVICSIIVLTASLIHCLLKLLETLFSVRQHVDVELPILLSPPMGRSVFHLLTEYDQCIYLVDEPGFSSALAYFRKYISYIDFEGRGHHQKINFVFEYGSYSGLKYLEKTLDRFCYGKNLDEVDWFNFSIKRSLLSSQDLIDELQLGDGRKRALISIGSSNLFYRARCLIQNNRATNDFSLFDIVFEETIFDMPVGPTYFGLLAS